MGTTVKPPVREKIIRINNRTGEPELNPAWHRFFDQLERVLQDKLDTEETYKVGDIYFTTLTTNPATRFGYGTWVRVAEGMFIVGQKTGDANFATAGDVAGTLEHKHSIDPPNTTSGGASVVNTDCAITGAANRAGAHTHDINIAAFDSETKSHLPPSYVLYAWRRTA